MKSSPYKRRRPSLLRNFWLYRKMIALAFVLGLLMWFILINNTPVKVVFPFGLGTIEKTTSGLAILLGTVVGSLTTGLVFMIVLALRRGRPVAAAKEPVEPPPAEHPVELPPPDYASRTTEGFSNAPWSTR